MTITFVQIKQGGVGSGLTTAGLTLTMPAGITQGNSIFAISGHGSATGAAVATTGGTGSDSFTLAASGNSSTPGASTDYNIFLLASAGSGRTGATITFTSTPTGGFGDFTIMEISGLADGNGVVSLDQTAFGDNLGLSTNYTTPNTATLFSANELCVAYTIGTNNAGSANSPWTDENQLLGTAARFAYQIVGSNSPIFGSFARGTNTNGFCVAATFVAGLVTNPSARIQNIIIGKQAMMRASYW